LVLKLPPTDRWRWVKSFGARVVTGGQWYRGGPGDTGGRSKPGTYVTKEWKVKQAAKMGTKEWDLAPGSGITEQGSLELYHEPR
jgi:hypothetical protein